MSPAPPHAPPLPSNRDGTNTAEEGPIHSRRFHAGVLRTRAVSPPRRSFAVAAGTAKPAPPALAAPRLFPSGRPPNQRRDYSKSPFSLRRMSVSSSGLRGGDSGLPISPCPLHICRSCLPSRKDRDHRPRPRRTQARARLMRRPPLVNCFFASPKRKRESPFRLPQSAREQKPILCCTTEVAPVQHEVGLFPLGAKMAARPPPFCPCALQGPRPPHDQQVTPGRALPSALQTEFFCPRIVRTTAP